MTSFQNLIGNDQAEVKIFMNNFPLYIIDNIYALIQRNEIVNIIIFFN